MPKNKAMTLYPKMVQVLRPRDRGGIFLRFAAEVGKDGNPDGEIIEVFIADEAKEALSKALKVSNKVETSNIVKH